MDSEMLLTTIVVSTIVYLFFRFLDGIERSKR